MIEYDRYDKDQGLLVEQFWINLTESGELDEIFMSDVQSLPVFYSMFNPPARMFYEIDDDGIWLAMWFSPFMAGAWMGAWVREDMRNKITTGRKLLAMLDLALTVVPVLLATTKKKEHLDLFMKLGYSISMIVPNLFGDQHGWLLQLHKDNFKHKHSMEQNNGNHTAGNTSTN